MKNHIDEVFEKKRLEMTLSIALNQLEKAKNSNEKNKEDLILAKQELRENSVHSVGSLWNGEDFEALIEMSQNENPVFEILADCERIQDRIVLLEAMVKTPYFARIDFRFKGEEEFEEIYIGRTSLKDEKTKKIYIFDWRSPVASVYYRFGKGEAYYDAPSGRIEGDVNLKRQYEIVDGKLDYFFDSEVQIIDAFLKKILSQNTSNKMKSIVATIQKEQDVVIRDMSTDTLLVQGVAGSGKTSVALHRVAYLMYQGLTNRLSANDILIVSPNSVFEDYISNVLPELGESNVSSLVFDDLMGDILKKCKAETRNAFIEKTLSAEEDRELIKSAISFKTSLQFKEVIKRLIQDIPNTWMQFEDVYFEGKLVIRKQRLKDKFMAGAASGRLGPRITVMQDYVFELIQGIIKRHLKKHEKALIREQIIFFMDMDVEEIYRQLFENATYFYKLCEGLDLPQNIEDIRFITAEYNKTNRWAYDDAIALSYFNLLVYGNTTYSNIRQVVIDEAQDYYPLQFECFKELFSRAQYTILGDVNQTLFKEEDMHFYEVIQDILGRKKSLLVTMDKSFRCTTEILEYSMRFLDTRGAIESFNRKGKQPKEYIYNEASALYKKMIAQVQKYRDKGYQSIAILCRNQDTSQMLYKEMKDRIDVRLALEEGSGDLHGTFIMPIYMSKGLEFDVVLIFDEEGSHEGSVEEKKLYYIASTRALHRLNSFFLKA